MIDVKSKGQILVVDDEDTIITVVTSILVDAGYTVLPAYSGEEALEVFSTNQVDVVVTDIRMGGMDGFELMKQLHLVDDNLNVIVMTGFDSYDAVLKALQAGAYDYLQKPLDNHSALLNAVDRAHASVKLQRENTSLVLQLEASHEKLSMANSRLIEANHKLKRLAATDTLTMLFNRRYFDQVLKREVDRRNRYKLPLSMVMVDIDYFKTINDKYGHEAGDNALKQVSSILVDCARTADIVARYGGEEFVIVLPQTSPESATVFAERIRASIEAADFQLLDGMSCKLTTSVGLAGVDATHGPIPVQSLVAAADKALYEAKSKGRNAYVLAPSLSDDTQKAA